MRFLVLIIVSLALAGGVIFFMIGQKTAPKVQVADGHYVLVSRVDVQPGTFIKTTDMLAWVELPAGKYSEEQQAKFLRKDATNAAEFDGAVARSFIAKNEPIVRTNVVTPKEGGFMSAVLYPGMRAVSVAVNLVSGNAGFIFPGDRVDLLLTHEVDDGNGTKSYATETFIEDVRVLAIDQKLNNPERQAFIPKTVTLEASPKQAEEILVAEELGKVSLILRSMGNVSFSEVQKPSSKGYTRDREVSKIITATKPNLQSGVITVTRGNTTQTISVEYVEEDTRYNNSIETNAGVEAIDSQDIKFGNSGAN